MEFFSSEDYQKYMYQVELREELKHSVQAGFQGVEVFYQPQVILGRYKIHGAEALLRYTSKQYGSVPPNIFIPILEKTGLMIPVGNWVMQKAFLQCAKWRKFHQNFRMSVNASYLQLREQGITEVIAKALKRAGIPGNAVSIELTEVLENSFRSTDLIGRLGEDEFMVFVRNIKSEKILRKKLDKMYQRMQKGENELSCSCGICMIQKDNFQYMYCLKRADEALYESKRSGKNHYTFAISS